MEIVEVPYSIENEAKIAKVIASTGMSRDEVIAGAIASFLSALGF
jgi:hypothetical protein